LPYIVSYLFFFFYSITATVEMTSVYFHEFNASPAVKSN